MTPPRSQPSVWNPIRPASVIAPNMAKLDPKKSKYTSPGNSTSTFNPLMGGSRKTSKASKASSASVASADSEDEKTTPTVQDDTPIILSEIEIPGPEPMEVDDDASPSPSPALPKFKKRTPSIVSTSPVPPVFLQTHDNDDDILVEAKAQLDELIINRRQEDRLKMQLTLHLNKSSPVEQEVHQLDLQTLNRQRIELVETYQTTNATRRERGYEKDK
ncbi:MAG: hypothetical protein J3R72DRAFT_499852 [Linnemannia gamsii]|nr:MAG: hypothetical protein J3R72DRAFT_499852 [Linnemannia gamsii]